MLYVQRRQWHPTPVLLPGKSHGWRSLVGCSPWGRESRTRLSDFTFTFHFHALEKEMVTHSSVFAWRIPGTGEPGGLPSMGLHRVGYDWSDLAAAAAACARLTSGFNSPVLRKHKYDFIKVMPVCYVQRQMDSSQVAVEKLAKLFWAMEASEISTLNFGFLCRRPMQYSWPRSKMPGKPSWKFKASSRIQFWD